MKRTWIFILSLLFLTTGFSEAKKYKYSLNVKKENKSAKKTDGRPIGREIALKDSMELNDEESGKLYEELKKINFAGFDKEPNSNKESFIIINPGEVVLTGYQIDIDYLDIDGRMLHSREIQRPCYVPAGETRRYDIDTWDIQHTYYYYLGNSPKRVATPFQVMIRPSKFWIEERAPK